ncbi:MAG: zinc dependent phospholipase C family protein [Chloroflexota bacterium]|nr:zinc dependent phospholipase C family protein [Chloroflexota bacterium]
MPTPVMHLALAEEILRGDDLSPAVRRTLTQQRGPFLLGHTMPDVQTISRQGREETHFYTIPRTTDRPAYEALFAAHPRLARAETLPPAQAAFIAGYIAHLLLDVIWLEDIFLRYFMTQEWESLGERLFLHNVLRTWLDAQDQQRLNGDVTAALSEVEPWGWLPFVGDEYLRTWRDWLVQQLGPARSVETAQVFARRMGVPATKVKEVLRSPQRMEERIFCHIPRTALQSFHDVGYERSVRLVEWYVKRET